MGDQWDDLFYDLSDQLNHVDRFTTNLQGDIYRAISRALVPLNGLNVDLLLDLDGC
jgi:hypothetical protein